MSVWGVSILSIISFESLNHNRMNAESFHRMNLKQRIARNMIEHCKLLTPLGCKPTDFVLASDIFCRRFFSHTCLLSIEIYAYPMLNRLIGCNASNGCFPMKMYSGSFLVFSWFSLSGGRTGRWWWLLVFRSELTGVLYVYTLLSWLTSVFFGICHFHGYGSALWCSMNEYTFVSSAILFMVS